MTVVVTARRLRVILPAAALSLVALVSWVSYWFFWGKGFDAVDAGRNVPAGVDAAQNTSMVVCALATVALTALAALVLARRKRPGIVGSPIAS